MTAILLASLLWAFSFSIIKHRLAGIDPSLLAFLRLALSTLLFVPFFRRGGKSWRRLVVLAMIGALQFGMMYIFYLSSFRFLSASEVALWTVVTPFWIMAFSNVFSGKWCRSKVLFLAVAVAATFLMVFNPVSGYRVDFRGVFLVQLSNICFAAGLLLYKKCLPSQTRSGQSALFALLYGGGALLALGFALSRSALSQVVLITPGEWLNIIYLGLVPSGVAFFLFNLGATRSSDLLVAIGNNLKIPLAIAVALLFAGESLPGVAVLGGALLYLVVLVSALIKK